jgi:hypothetical protein
MDQALLVEDIIDGGRKLIDALSQDGFPVTAAAWLRETDGGQWYLYLASPVVDSIGRTAAYRQFQHSFRRVGPSLGFGPFEVRLIPTDDPVAQAVKMSQSQYSGPIDTWRGVNQFGGVPVESVFVYGARRSP